MKVNFSQQVPKEITLLYDRRFDSFKKDLLIYWMLKTTAEKRECSESELKAEIKKRLRLNRLDSLHTPLLWELYNEALKTLVEEKRWLDCRVEFDEEGEKIRSFSCTPEGESYLKKADQQRENLRMAAFSNFCEVVLRHLNIEPEKKPIDTLRVWFEEALDWSRLPPGYSIDDVSFTAALEKYFEELEELKYAKILKGIGYPGIPELKMKEQTIWKVFFVDSFKEKEKENFSKAIRKVHKQILEEEGTRELKDLENWLYQRAAERFLANLLPYDKKIRERIDYPLEYISVYLDTNVIVALLSSRDPAHNLSRYLLEFIESHNIKFFWDSWTEKELRANLLLSKRLAEFLSNKFSIEINKIVGTLADIPSFVRSYFLDNWTSWQKYEKYVMEKYQILKEKSVNEVLKSVIKNELNALIEEKTDVFQPRIRQLKEKYGVEESSFRIKHDARALAIIAVLRDQLPDKLLPPEGRKLFEKGAIIGSPFWFLTFDSAYKAFVEAGKGAGIEVPLTLAYKSLVALYDPHLLVKVLGEELEHKEARLFQGKFEEFFKLVREDMEAKTMEQIIKDLEEEVEKEVEKEMEEVEV